VVTRRVVITGMGVLSPLGIGVAENWRRLCAGESGIGPITRFDTSEYPTKIAGEVRGFEPSQWNIAKKEVRQMDLFIQYAIAGAALAVADAGLDKRPPPDPERFGVFVGAGLGGITTLESTIAALRDKGPRHGISPYFVPAIIVNLAAGQISIRHGAKGPNLSHVSACSTGAHSIGEAFRTITHGTADVMIAGGTESTVSPLGIGGFARRAPSAPATTSPPAPRARSAPRATASSSARAAASSSSRSSSTPGPAGPRRSPRSSATASPATPTTSPCRRRAGRGPSAA
jgi:3-oxoacyl-[acyl-carrier-protein] synthase II